MGDGLSRSASARIPHVDVPVRACDQIWLVSTRSMGGFPTRRKLCTPRYDYQRYLSCSRWRRQCSSDFFQCADPRAINIMYVHGNRMTQAWVKSRGLMLYRKLVCQNPGRPIRMILWSWPSAPIPRRAAVFRDARVKYRRTPLQSYYLAKWLSRLGPQEQVALLGYSYGGRTIQGALQLLAGQPLEGRCLRCCCGPRLRMAIWAPASQSDWLSPGQPHDHALSRLEQALIFYNHCDPILARYQKFICSATGPALGYVGLSCLGCGMPCGCIQQFDATGLIGKQHKYDAYANCPIIMNQVRRLALDWDG